MDYQEKLNCYDTLVNACEGFERKGKSMPYTSANGYMFSQLNKAGELGIRLPKDLQQKFMEQFNSGPFYSYGAQMKDYVLVPDSLLSDISTLLPYLQKGYEFVMSLPPK